MERFSFYAAAVVRAAIAFPILVGSTALRSVIC
jgi:hypothetical protein